MCIDVVPIADCGRCWINIESLMDFGEGIRCK